MRFYKNQITSSYDENSHFEFCLVTEFFFENWYLKMFWVDLIIYYPSNCNNYANLFLLCPLYLNISMFN